MSHHSVYSIALHCTAPSTSTLYVVHRTLVVYSTSILSYPFSCIYRGSYFHYDSSVSFWNFLAAGNYAARFYKFAMTDVTAMQAKLQQESFAAVAAVEEVALKVLATASYNAATAHVSELLTKATNEEANKIVGAWRDLLPRLITKYVLNTTRSSQHPTALDCVIAAFIIILTSTVLSLHDKSIITSLYSSHDIFITSDIMTDTKLKVCKRKRSSWRDSSILLGGWKQPVTSTVRSTQAPMWSCLLLILTLTEWAVAWSGYCLCCSQLCYPLPSP